MQENLKAKYGLTDVDWETLKVSVILEMDPLFDAGDKSFAALRDLINYGDIRSANERPATMREYIRDHIEEILDKIFLKNPICEICPYGEECDKIFKERGPVKIVALPCDVNPDLSKDNGKRFLDSPATPENVAKLGEATSI